MIKYFWRFMRLAIFAIRLRWSREYGRDLLDYKPDMLAELLSLSEDDGWIVHSMLMAMRH